MRRAQVAIAWRQGDEIRRTESVIDDVRTRDGAEYVVLTDGTEIRLDDLVEVDGIGFGANC